MDSANAEVVLTFIEAMSTGDMEAAAQCLSDDVRAITKGFTNFTGISDRGVMLAMIGSMKHFLPTGLGATVQRVIADGDTVAVEFSGNARTVDGMPYCNEYCMVFDLAKGKIRKVHEYMCTRLAEDVLWPLVEKAGLRSNA